MNEVLPGKNIFLVEDSLEVSRMYERAFRLRGHQLEIAYDGETALERLTAIEPTPDAILLDVMVPHMHGADLLQALRANPKFANVAIIILTNSFQKQDAAQFIELGADLYLVKIEHQSKQIVDQVEALISRRAETHYEQNTTH